MLMFNDLENQAGDETKSTDRLGSSLGFNFDATDYYKTALSSVNVLKTGTEILNKLAGELKDILSLEKSFERLAYLDEQSTKLNKTLGLGAQKADEFRKLIIDASAQYAELGLSLDQIGKDYIALSNVFNSNISLSDETLTELAATTLVTGQKGDALAKSFRQVGVDVAGIAPRMMEVTEVAKQAGVTVGSVATGVVSNISKLNLYNFEGGVKGLAKMSAQASRLGIDMKSIFTLTEKVFNPEGAIETAAALQRLGVTTNSLLDPLKLMDLSQNDPTELQNQIVNMTKDFVKFNKDLGEFQILPGEKRRLREVAEALGMTSDELAGMALNASNLDYKMKQIKFAPGTSKEDREMIATLSQIAKNDRGEMVAQLKVKQYAYNEKTGKDEWTGEYEMVDATKVTATQLKELRESQELKGATMEEIAIKQQGELESLNNKVESIKTAIGMGVTRTSAAQSLYKMGTTGVKNELFADATNPGGMIPKSFRDAENVGKFLDKGLESANELFTTLKTKLGKIEDIGDVFTLAKEVGTDALDFFSNLNMESLFGDMGVDILSKMSGGSPNTSPGAKPSPSSINTSSVNATTSNSNSVTSNSNTSNTSNINNINSPKPQELNLNENIKLDLNVTLDPSAKDQALSFLINQELTRFFSNDGGSKNIAFVLNEIEKQKTQNNLIQSNVPQ